MTAADELLIRADAYSRAVVGGPLIKDLAAALRQANQAFDECTGDYAKELVADEPWRVTP